MINGRGWICVALVVFASWRPGKALLGALLFAFFDALQLRLQQSGDAVLPYQIYLMLPYLLSILALVLVARRAAYPQALLALGHSPPVLYYVGNPDLLNARSLAIVGSRSATAQGTDNARAFASALSDAGLVIVSGLALGIDGAAHEGALNARAGTLAVVGTGLDRVYPARHRDLAHRIAARGGLLSEFAPGTPPRDFHFPQRNRLISGLSQGVLVVEATLHSGSLITARYAGEQGRDVFAIPGSIHSPLSKGCHKLIREGAKLVETAQDVLEEMGLALPAPGLQSETGAPMSEGAVLDALGGDPVDVDTLVDRTGLAADEVHVQLTRLALEGDVASLPGGRWQRRK